MANGYDIFSNVFTHTKDKFVLSDSKKYAVSFHSADEKDAKYVIDMHNRFNLIDKEIKIDLYVISRLTKAFDNNFHITAVAASNEIKDYCA